ncbi:MAG: hypothetical protein M3O50_19785 [Myxococcota bacterium]|nr:hypothetical protein [Myxococcota bacterium]
MFEVLKPRLLLIIVGLGMTVAASWSFHRRRERAHRLLMAGCACLGVWAFTLFGAFHDHGALGHQNFHAHDFYHYYFGSKYLPEWGYDGMYFATVAALEEIGREEPRKAIRFERIHDLRGSASFVYRDQFMPLADAARARFTPERWAALKRDLSFFRDKTMDSGWWLRVLLDNGFNPPPSYAVISGAVSNRIPLNEFTWKWLGALDFILLGVGVGAISYAIGPVAGLFTLVILGNAPITTYNWTGGSFLRQVWLFFLMLGVAALARRRWVAAGSALGACAASVLFPVFFLTGALVPLGYRFFRARSRRALQGVAIGAAAGVVVLVGVSLLSYGPSAWTEWHHRIEAHGVTFFDNHIGLKKITTFAPEVAHQAFGAGDLVYPEWNHALVARLHRGEWADILLKLFLSLWLFAGALRARPAEACLVVGSGLLVVWTMPAGYYTIYVGVVAAVMLANRSSPWARARFLTVCAALFAALLMYRFEHDLITQMVLLSVGWLVCLLTVSSLYWIERPPFAQTVRQRMVTVGGAAVVSGALFLFGAVPRNKLHEAAFLPPEVLGGSHIVDVLDVGAASSEATHHLSIAEELRVPRHRMDTFGYRVDDDCGILRRGGVLRYSLAAAPHGGRIVIRTDSFYRGELLTTVNGRSLPYVRLDPYQTLFTYLQIPLPPDLGDGPLFVDQVTTANDVGVFTAWLVQPEPVP